jgi:hypothetical protein
VSQSATAWARSGFVGPWFQPFICWPRHDKVKTPQRGELCLSEVMNVGVPTQRQRQVRCQRCPANLLKLPHDCSDCMTLGHRLLRVYEMISGTNCSGNDALDIAQCPKCANNRLIDCNTTATSSLYKRQIGLLLRIRKKHSYFKDVNPGRSSQRCPLRLFLRSHHCNSYTFWSNIDNHTVQTRERNR